MDIIADTNIYLADPKMTGNRFQELFAYMRRTGSRLVIPHLVHLELLERYRDQLREVAEEAAKEWAKMRSRAVSDPGDFPAFDVDWQVEELHSLLKKPSRDVHVIFDDDIGGIDVRELIRRGVCRIKPASAAGEELRDVMLWMTVLNHAKKVGRETSFISNDRAFADETGMLHDQMASDITGAAVRFSFYKDIGRFIAANSLETEDVTEEWLSGALAKEAIEEETKRALSKAIVTWGSIQGVEVDAVKLSGGKRYRVGVNSFYAELLIGGTARLLIRTTNYINVVHTMPLSVGGTGALVAKSNTPDEFMVNLAGGVSLGGFVTDNVSAIPSFTFGQVPGGGYVPSSAMEAKTAEQVYRSQFEIELSARVVGDTPASLQTQRLKVTSLEPVPDLASRKL
jgi:PIN domain-containing protein